jgi:hypothetical protein
MIRTFRLCMEHGPTWSGNEFDEPSKPEKTDAKDDKTTDERQSCSNLLARPLLSVGVFDILNDLGNRKRHNRDGTDGNVLGSSKELRADQYNFREKKE